MCWGGVLICIANSSCKNFLEGSDFKSQLEADIAYANAKPCEIRVECDEGAGSFVTDTILTKKVTDSFTIEFKMASGYQFSGWSSYTRGTDGTLTALPEGYITFTDYNTTDGVYKVTAKYTKEASGIVIKPVCYLLPAVTGSFPPFASTGYDQDSTVQITFNKSVNAESFGDFSCISIKKSDGTELFLYDEESASYTYFEPPYFSDGHTVLNIPTVKGSYILPVESDASTLDLTLTLNVQNIKDAQGLALDSDFSYTYRINKQVDSVKPVITDLHLYSTSDTTDYFYKELTATPFESWSEATVYREDGNALYQNGDFSRNHVSRLYLELSSYDKDSGLKELRISETYKRDTSGSAVTAEAKTTVYNATDFESATDENGATVYNCQIEYDFDSENPNDGLYLIQVSTVDKAANQSEVAEYWVIKDTYNSFILNSLNVLYWQPTTPLIATRYYTPTYNSDTGEWETGFPFNTFKIDADTFYDSSTSQRLMSMEFYDGEEKPSEDKIYKVITETNVGEEVSSEKTNISSMVRTAFSEYKRNPQKTTNLIITIKEESGVTGSVTLQIPKSTHISQIIGNSAYPYDVGYSLDFLPSGSFNYYIFYTYQSVAEDGTVSTPGKITYLGNYTYNNISSLSSKDDGIYNLYISRQTIQTGIECYLYSALENSFTYYKGVSSPYAETPDDFKFPEFTLPDTGEITYEQNTGTAKFSVAVDYFEKGDYSYILNFNGAHKYSFSTGENIELENGYEYTVYVSALDSSGNYVGESEEKTLSLKTVDNIAPYATSDLNLYPKIYIESGSYRDYNFPYDYNESRTKNNLYYVEYYFVPESYGTTLDLDYLNSGLFKKTSATITDADITNGYFEIPFDGLPYGNYYVYFYAVDNSPLKNYTLKCNTYPIQNFTADCSPTLSITNDSKIKISLVLYASDLKPVPSAPTTLQVRDKFINVKTLQDNTWNDYTEITSEEKLGASALMDYDANTYTYIFNLDYDTFSGKFLKLSSKYSTATASLENLYNVYTKPLYVYPDYYKYLYDYEQSNPGETAPAYCASKNWLYAANGYQIFTDKPCFVHARYCSVKLTPDGDTSKEAAYEWEARAQETGIVYNDGTATTFSYTASNLAAVPSGYYYTTICHFADGTVLMSDVLQK